MGDGKRRWDNDRSRAAIRLSRMGYAVLPIQTNVKLPFFDLLPRGEDGKPHWIPLREHPADEDTITGWFKKNFKCNLGIILGQTGTVVLDCDGPVPEDLPIPDTVTTETIRKETGRHFYFRHQGSIKHKPMTWVWEEGGTRYKIELKANGRYVLAPPSRFEKDGKVSQYIWSPGKSLFDREPAAFPLEVLDYLDSKMPKSKTASKKRVKTKEKGKPRPVGRKGLNKFEDLMRDENTVFKIMSKCGVEVSAIGPSFLCPLPGHNEKSPSASLFRREDDVIMFRDWHQREHPRENKENEWYPVPLVFASCITGKSINKFSDDWIEPWCARALYESKCMDRKLPTVPNQTELPLSKDAKAARIFYDGLVYRLQLLWLLRERKNWRKADRFTYFPYRFATHWKGMGNGTFIKGRDWLLNAGYIEQAILMEVHDIPQFTPPKKSKEEIVRIEGSIFALRLPDK